jgi:hypothetical protein
MSPRPSTSIRTLLSCSALVALAMMVLAAPAPARAGIGNPLKKVKEKIAKKAEPAQPGQPGKITDDNTVVFDDVTLELTGERLDRIVNAYESAQAAGAGRPAAVEKLNKANADRGKLWDKHGETIVELQRKRDEIETCRHDGYREAQDRLTQEYSQKALTDPAIREKFARAAAENNAAAAKGDSAAIQRINAVLMSETLISRADSLEIQKRCGPKPPPIPPEGQIAALDKVIAAQNEEIRSIDEKVAEAQAKDIQMNREQFGMAAERIQMFLAWERSQSKPTPSPRGFTQEEIDAMEKRIAKLRGAVGP